MLRIFEKIVDNYKVDPGKLDSLVLRKGLLKFTTRLNENYCRSATFKPTYPHYPLI